MTTETGPERTIGQLVADATHDVQGIVRSEIALAKAEVSSGAKVMGKGVGLLAGAGFVGLLGLIFLFHTLARVIAVWLPVWAGYGIVTLIMFIVAGRPRPPRQERPRQGQAGAEPRHRRGPADDRHPQVLSLLAGQLRLRTQSDRTCSGMGRSTFASHGWLSSARSKTAPSSSAVKPHTNKPPASNPGPR